MPFPDWERHFLDFFRFIVLSCAGSAFGDNFSRGSQGPLGHSRADQLIHQHRKEHHIPGHSAIRQGCRSQGHAQSHTGLGQQRDAQVVANGFGLLGQVAAQIRAEYLPADRDKI